MTKFPSGCEDGGHPWVTASIRHFYLGAMRANLLLERAKIRSLARHWHVWRREIVAAAAAASVAAKVEQLEQNMSTASEQVRVARAARQTLTDLNAELNAELAALKHEERLRLLLYPSAHKAVNSSAVREANTATSAARPLASFGGLCHSRAALQMHSLDGSTAAMGASTPLVHLQDKVTVNAASSIGSQLKTTTRQWKQRVNRHTLYHFTMMLRANIVMEMSRAFARWRLQAQLSWQQQRDASTILTRRLHFIIGSARHRQTAQAFHMWQKKAHEILAYNYRTQKSLHQREVAILRAKHDALAQALDGHLTAHTDALQQALDQQRQVHDKVLAKALCAQKKAHTRPMLQRVVTRSRRRQNSI